MDYRAALFGLIEQVLAEQISPETLEDAFYAFYFDEVSESALTQGEHDFIGGVCERLDFTGPAPDAESRGYGWIDYPDFVDWLRSAYSVYQTGPTRPRDRDRTI